METNNGIENTIEIEESLHNGSADQDEIKHELLVKRKKPSLIRLALITVCFVGVQFGWALQIALLTPFMLELGLPKVLVTIVWLCGPLAGLIVQPVVGAISDRSTTRFGRRKPFIVVGAVFIVISLLLIPFSLDIGKLLGDTPSKNNGAIFTAVVGFWILDFSNNMLQGPCRALLADMAHDDQQTIGNAIFSVWLALGNISGYLAGFVNWSEYTSIFETEVCHPACQNLKAAFILSIILLVITVTISVLSATEDKMPASAQHTQQNVIIHLVKTIFKMPKPLRRICTVQFFSWFAWFTFLIFITAWVGEDIFGGNPKENSPEYLEGVRWGSFGLAGYAILSLVFSPVIPLMCKIFGYKPTWILGCLIQMICLFTPLIIRLSHVRFAIGKWLAIVVISTFGIPWSMSMTIPFALTGIHAPAAEKGIYLGILNIFIVLPQLLMSALGPLISYLANEEISAILAVGAVFAFFAAISCFWLITKKESPKIVQSEVILESRENMAAEEKIKTPLLSEMEERNEQNE